MKNSDAPHAAMPPDGTPVRLVRRSMPEVPRDTWATVRHQSPSGVSNLPTVVWLELDFTPSWWTSDGPAGYWAGRWEFDFAAGAA